jgi:hypothetical protein
MVSRRRRNPKEGAMPSSDVYACTIEMPNGKIEYFDTLTLGATPLNNSSKPFMSDLMKSLTTVLENMYWEMDLDINLSIEFRFGSSVSIKIDNTLPNSTSIEMELPSNITSWTQEMATALGEKVYQVFTDDPMYDDEMDEFDIIFELS